MNSATYVRRNVSCMTSTHIYTYKYGDICTKHTYICGQGSIFENTHRKLMTLLSFEKDSLLKKKTWRGRRVTFHCMLFCSIWVPLFA